MAKHRFAEILPTHGEVSLAADSQGVLSAQDNIWIKNPTEVWLISAKTISSTT